jgi:hypothetical protein
LRWRFFDGESQGRDSRQGSRVGHIQAFGIIAVDTAGQQEPVFGVVEDRDGVEQRKPLARQVERVAGGRGQALVPAGGLVGHEADGPAQQRRVPHTLRGGRAQ